MLSTFFFQNPVSLKSIIIPQSQPLLRFQNVRLYTEFTINICNHSLSYTSYLHGQSVHPTRLYCTNNFKSLVHIINLNVQIINTVCLFSWRYNSLWFYFHSPIAGFSLLVFEVSCSHTTTRHSWQDSSGRVINS
jgi:predicted GH43/DUF377 family glycosyl hydrolase